MRYLTLGEVVEVHRRVLAATGGALGIRDLGALESCLAQPKTTFGGAELYPTVIEKAAALCFSLMLDLAAGKIGRVQLTDWLHQHVRPTA